MSQINYKNYYAKPEELIEKNWSTEKKAIEKMLQEFLDIMILC